MLHLDITYMRQDVCVQIVHNTNKSYCVFCPLFYVHVFNWYRNPCNHFHKKIIGRIFSKNKRKYDMSCAAMCLEQK